MFSTFGQNIRITVFGESHGTGIGVVMDGFPAGEAVSMEELNRFMARRAPGQRGTTPRKEKDTPEVLSGLQNDTTTGSALAMIIRNKDHRSDDYITDIPRPSHADLNAHLKYGGHMDMRGGGPFSGRITAPLCLAGGVAKQILARRGIAVGAHLAAIGAIEDARWDPVLVRREELEQIGRQGFPAIDPAKADAMLDYLDRVKDEEDSVGGRIGCMATGVPAGLGEPNYLSVESHLSHLLFSVPGVRGVQFGTGFAAAKMRGSEHNDPIRLEDGRFYTQTNHAGGIVGGITNGMPLVVEVAMKPAASIGQKQRSVSLSQNRETDLRIEGRHDPSIAVRAVPVIEACMAITLLDFMEGKNGITGHQK
jgi:chorismate synthase